MSEIVNTPENTTPAAVEPKLTHREKLMQKYEKLAVKAAALTAEINAIVAEVSHLDALSNIAVGTEVVAFVGKGEKAASVAGVVVGVKDDEDGLKVYKVQYGVGFDADIAVVKQSNISLPAASPEAHGYPE